MRTHDVSAQPKTGEALLQLVIEDIKWSEETYGLSIIAACSDDGGDARKMRRVLLALMPWLIITLCWAHQIHLVIGDYLSLKLPFQDRPQGFKGYQVDEQSQLCIGIILPRTAIHVPKVLGTDSPCAHPMDCTLPFASASSHCGKGSESCLA